jgi:hypothetical protein
MKSQMEEKICFLHSDELSRSWTHSQWYDIQSVSLSRILKQIDPKWASIKRYRTKVCRLGEGLTSDISKYNQHYCYYVFSMCISISLLLYSELCKPSLKQVSSPEKCAGSVHYCGSTIDPIDVPPWTAGTLDNRLANKIIIKKQDWIVCPWK